MSALCLLVACSGNQKSENQVEETTQNADTTSGEQSSDEAEAKESSTATGFLLTCNGIVDMLTFDQSISEVKSKLGAENVQAIMHPDGDCFEVKLQNGETVLMWDRNFDNAGEQIGALSISTSQIKLKEGVHAGMLVEDINKLLGVFDCEYSEEVGSVGVPVGKLSASYPCLGAVLATEGDTHISEHLAASLKRKGKFRSDDAEFLRIKPFLFSLELFSSELIQ
ncbi:MAG: hypothetical protein JJT94_16190 [Bernardetiaceae bacterium]|nr:hypothetical protein [Bernardetiaceae bacterium]